MLVGLSRWVGLEKSAMIRPSIDGMAHEPDPGPEMPLLWALRDTVGLTGTMYHGGRRVSDTASRQCKDVRS